ncbi:hypothetical protein ACLOJK_032190 [Asimina triloba]
MMHQHPCTAGAPEFGAPSAWLPSGNLLQQRRSNDQDRAKRWWCSPIPDPTSSGRRRQPPRCPGNNSDVFPNDGENHHQGSSDRMIGAIKQNDDVEGNPDPKRPQPVSTVPDDISGDNDGGSFFPNDELAAPLFPISGLYPGGTMATFKSRSVVVPPRRRSITCLPQQRFLPKPDDHWQQPWNHDRQLHL